jgi:DNA-binding GntR family transcriptional regulator
MERSVWMGNLRASLTSFPNRNRLPSISFAISFGWQFSVNEHRAILNGIKAKDAAGAERAARQHAYNTVDRVLARLEKKK